MSKDELSSKATFLASVIYVMGSAYTSTEGTPTAQTSAEALLSIAMQVEELGKQIAEITPD